MAGGIDWFRWHHGSVSDPKFQLVARKAGTSLGNVIAVWVVLLETGSKNGASVAKFDDQAADALLGVPRLTSLHVYRELVARGFISKDAISSPRRYFPAATMRPSGGLWASIRRSVLERDGHTCQYCGDTVAPMECDHVVPVADGGGHEAENLKAACRPCNRAKGARTVEQWRSSDGR